MASTLKVRIDENCGTIILDRPEKHNALSRLMVSEILAAISDMYQTKRVRAIVLTGGGSSFCAGTDLDEVRATSQQHDPLSVWQSDASAIQELIMTMMRLPKPIIAAVNGPAIGAGAALVLAADIAVAAPQAEISFPEPRRGLVAGVAVPLLVFRVGGGQAARLLLTGEPLAADQASAIGLYHEIVDHDVLWARSQQIAGQCQQAAFEALALTKKTLNDTAGELVSTWLSTGAAATASARTTEAAREGVTAFLDKRSPRWP